MPGLEYPLESFCRRFTRLSTNRFQIPLWQGIIPAMPMKIMKILACRDNIVEPHYVL
jgi:hypothetical protein